MPYRSAISTIERDFKQALHHQDQLLINELPAYGPDGTPMPNLQGNSRRQSVASCLTDRTSPSQRGDYESPTTSPTLDGCARPPSIRPTSPLGSVNPAATDLIDFSNDINDDGSESVQDILARASDLLSNCPERDSILRRPVTTLDWDPPNPKNLVSDAMHKRFLANARRGADDRRISTEDLLRTGTWWVLKVRDVRPERRPFVLS